MNHLQRTTDPLSHQGGLSIVEMMVAMLISVLLLAGVVQIFISTKSTYRTQEALSRLQENARFAVSFVNRRVRLAGYMGCLSTGNSNFTSKLNGGTDFSFDLGTPIEGFDASGTDMGESYAVTATFPAPSASAGDWSPALDADLVGRVVPGTDVLVVRNASTNSYPLVSPYNDSAQIFVTTPNDFQVGEILIATDCVKSTAFQATSINTSGANITHSSASLTPGNAAPVWNIPAEQYGAGAELMRAETSIYYIGQREAGAPPSLFHRRFQTNTATSSTGLASEELIDGVEGMQVVYGQDTDDDGSADAYVSASAVGDWTQIVSVRVALLMRSEEQVRVDTDTGNYDLAGTTVDPVDDRRLRDVVSTTITLRNRIH